MRDIRIIIVVLGLLVSVAVRAGDGPVLQLRMDHAALVAAETDYRARRERGTLAGVEASDYAAYIARLQRRVIEDCVNLSRASTPVSADLPCPQTLPPVAGPADIDLQSEQTLAERVAALDAELDSGLGDYDEMLLREQERIKAAAPRTAATGSGTGDGTGGGTAEGTGDGTGAAAGETGAGGREGGDAEAAGDGADAASAGATAHGAGAGGGGQQTVYAPPPDIPDGSDDDVVARQLREAAEKEPDPELRKKLWDEYRKYKQGTR